MSGTWQDGFLDCLDGSYDIMSNKSTNSECPTAASCYALTNSEYEQACVNIYMSLHVSQLDTVSKQVKDSWVVGQKIYNERKRGA
jgi:hypothetical protein